MLILTRICVKKELRLFAIGKYVNLAQCEVNFGHPWYRVSKQWAQAKEDVPEVKIIKDTTEKPILDHEKVKNKRKKYYETLLK